MGVAASVGLGAAMLPFRPHLNLATTGLVLVLPVVAGVIVGGFAAGMASAIAGFVVYDYAFTRPYGELGVGSAQEWVALAVYVLVMLLVSRVVANLQRARTDAQRLASETRRLFELSELLVEESTVEDLLRTIVRAVRTAFDIPGVALLVPDGERLEIAASDGERLSPAEIHQLDAGSGVPVSLGTATGSPDRLRTVALTASGRPVGILALRGAPTSPADRALLGTFANHAALALERAQLRERAMRSELLEEGDRLRRALMGAVSHDLRTPLATMKVASSTLLNPVTPLGADDVAELHSLIDLETDRLTRLVTSLLDMSRYDAGVLDVHRAPAAVDHLVRESLTDLRSALGERTVEVRIPDALPKVDVDPLLIGQVLANLLDNAHRHAPPGTVITVSGEFRRDRVAVSVADRGPGVPPEEHDVVFDRFTRFDTGGRAGLGLNIAKTFVEAHGERVWVEDVTGGGARFVFTLPPAGVGGLDPDAAAVARATRSGD